MNFFKLAAEEASGNRNREFIQLFAFSQNINSTVLLGFLESSKTIPLLIPLKGKKLLNYFNISAAVNTALHVFFTTVAFFPNNFFKFRFGQCNYHQAEDISHSNYTLSINRGRVSWFLWQVSEEITITGVKLNKIFFTPVVSDPTL